MQARMLGILARRLFSPGAAPAAGAAAATTTTASSSRAAAAAAMAVTAARAAVAGGAPPGCARIIPGGQQQQQGWQRRGLSTEAAPASAAEGGGAGAEAPPLDDVMKPKPPRNSLVGVVVSDRMDKSIVVRVSRIKLFLPYMVRKRTFKKIMAHDEENACGIGDVVRIRPTRPLSKRKRFMLHEVLRKDPKLTIET